MEIIDIHPKALGQFMVDVLKNNPEGHVFKGETLYILQQVLNTTDMLCVGANEKGFKNTIRETIDFLIRLKVGR